MQHRLYSPERNYILHAYYILFEGCKCTKNTKVTGSCLNSPALLLYINKRTAIDQIAVYDINFILQTTNRTPIDP
jgi:hypothetical protein